MLWAAKVRQQILGTRQVRSRMAYVNTSIRERPQDFLPPVELGARPQLRAAPEWCGYCNEATRQLELPDDTAARCPSCHPLASENRETA